VANSDIYDYLKVIGIAIALAFLFSVLYVLLLAGLSHVTKLLDRLSNIKVINEWRKARIRSSVEPSWVTLFRNIIRIRDSIGAGYTFHIKVHLKDGEHVPFQYSGLLWKYDEESRNIVIHPRYVGKCNDKQLIINTLLPLVTNTMIKDKQYRERLLKCINKAAISDAEMITEVRNKLVNTGNLSDFSNAYKK
jgi:hypothetical protein